MAGFFLCRRALQYNLCRGTLVATTALLLTLKLSLIVSAILLVVGMPLGAWIAFSRTVIS